MRYITVYKHEDHRAEGFQYTEKFFNDAGIKREVIIDPRPGEPFSYTRSVREYLGHYRGIACVMDADVYLEPCQINDAGIVAAKGYPFVLPYDGRVFENLGPEARGLITSAAVGGIQVFNCGVYLDMCGGENPNFKLWGEEDLERFSRVCKFARVPRIKGPLYHYAHARGLPNHDYMSNNIEEYDKVDKMTAADVEQYVKTW